MLKTNEEKEKRKKKRWKGKQIVHKIHCTSTHTFTEMTPNLWRVKGEHRFTLFEALAKEEEETLDSAISSLPLL